jgi:hypothetical protein
VPFRKAYLQSLIDVIEVDDHRIRIQGNKDVLERAVVAGHIAESGSQMSTRWARPKRFELLTPRFVVWRFWGGCTVGPRLGRQMSTPVYSRLLDMRWTLTPSNYLSY